jgi:hypothetical protein
MLAFDVRQARKRIKYVARKRTVMKDSNGSRPCENY